MEFDLENPLSGWNENLGASYFEIENDHMPSKDYIRTLISSSSSASSSSTSNLFFIRAQITSSIFHISRHFHPFLPYLAINYMDRFLSAHSIPEGKAWIFRLVAVSCVSLALKMRKQDFSVSHLMDDGGVMFDCVWIERMEMLILGALKWRMRSINPFSFLNYFIPFFNSNSKQHLDIQALKNRATHIILKSQNDIKLLEFKPSIISASALLSASHHFFPMHFQSFRDSIYACIYVIKEDLQRCYDVMQEAEAVAAASRSLTPANVLDWISETQSNHMSEAAKSGSVDNRSKRRQNFENFTINNSFQLSQRDQ